MSCALRSKAKFVLAAILNGSPVDLKLCFRISNKYGFHGSCTQENILHFSSLANYECTLANPVDEHCLSVCTHTNCSPEISSKADMK